MYTETVEISGHIIDSLLLPKILDDITRHEIEFTMEHVEIGKRRADPSNARIRLTAKDSATLENVIRRIRQHGAVLVDEKESIDKEINTGNKE